MENQPEKSTKKGVVLLLGILIGLLAGALVALLVSGRMNPKSPSEVKVIVPETQGSKDTVVKYVIHQYQPGEGSESVNGESDSLQTDSLYLEEGFMDYMLEDEEDERLAEVENTNVSSEKLVSRYDAPVLYFDANKNAMEAPDRAHKTVEVQFWSTPIRNKIVYSFEGNVLKIKGVQFNEPNLIHYKDRYYLQSNNRIYLIQPTSEYKRLTEIHDVTF